MSLCPAPAATAARTPPRELRGEGPARRGASGSKLCCRGGLAWEPAPGPERTSPSDPSHLLLFLLRRRGPRGPHFHDLALLPDTLTPRPSWEEAGACAAPDLGAIHHAAPAVRSTSTLRGGHVWGGWMSRKGKGSERGEAEGAPDPAGAAWSPRPTAPGRPRRGQRQPGPAQAKPGDRAAQLPSRSLPGGGRGATCPPPSGHRRAEPGRPTAAVPARRVTRARPIRPARVANSWAP